MTTTYFPELAERVRSQRELQPSLYGDFDFEIEPYRLATKPHDVSALPSWATGREAVLADDRVVELMSTATFLGDVVADPYASLLGAGYSLKALVGMLQTACREGIDAVPNAPDELKAFIGAMEATPAWLDMELVEEGARAARVPAAFLSPFLIRGAFLATFTNTYAALPMALTGALSSRRAAHRVHETANFFTVTTMPGAMERHGAGFEAAAMVRLMHSMVRYNALKRTDKWDAAVYGLPIPQVDQMPAGLINVFLIAVDVVRAGRTEFTRSEQAVVEFGRYRCFLLGLPEELLPSTPLEIVQVFTARSALLRGGFDDETCGALVRSTMEAQLRPGTSWFDRVAEAVEMSWSKDFFCRAFCNNDATQAKAMGVELTRADKRRVMLSRPFVLGRFIAVTLAEKVPGLRQLADLYTVLVVKKRLVEYGNAEFTTDRWYSAHIKLSLSMQDSITITWASPEQLEEVHRRNHRIRTRRPISTHWVSARSAHWK